MVDRTLKSSYGLTRLHGNMKGTVPGKVVLKEGWTFIRSSTLFNFYGILDFDVAVEQHG